jgi:hypothetical protein
VGAYDTDWFLIRDYFIITALSFHCLLENYQMMLMTMYCTRHLLKDTDHVDLSKVSHVLYYVKYREQHAQHNRQVIILHSSEKDLFHQLKYL